MYGFVRTGVLIGSFEQCVEQLRAYADSEGFDLGAVFDDPGDGSGFEELMCELRRSEARHVLVPTEDHLCGLPVPRGTLLARLSELGAGVWPSPGYQHGQATTTNEAHELIEATEDIKLAPLATATDLARLRTRVALSRWGLVEMQGPVERMVAEMVNEALEAMKPLGGQIMWAEALRVQSLVVRLRKTPAQVLINLAFGQHGANATLIREGSVGRGVRFC